MDVLDVLTVGPSTPRSATGPEPAVMDVLDVLAVEPSTPRAFEHSSPRSAPAPEPAETREASAQGSPAPLGPLELE
eukprot:5099007-Alexandrium_andersonii.AAC.1